MKKPDPILEAIDLHKQAYEAFAKACEPRRLRSGQEDEELDALNHDEFAARWALAQTAPTTLAGLIAVLEYEAAQTEVVGETFFDEDHGEGAAFLASILRGAQTMAAG